MFLFKLGIGIYFLKVFDIILIINKMFVFNIKVFLVYYLIEICLFFIFVYDFYDNYMIYCLCSNFVFFLKKNKKWIKYVILWLNIEIYINLY